MIAQGKYDPVEHQSELSKSFHVKWNILRVAKDEFYSLFIIANALTECSTKPSARVTQRTLGIPA